MREYEPRRRWTSWHLLAILLILGLLVALLFLINGMTDRGPTGSRPSQVAAAPTGTASARGSAATSALPSSTTTPRPAASASTGPAPPPAETRPPTATSAPAPTFSSSEASLRYALREDALDGCAPRRTDLPAGATAAIECRPGADRYGDSDWWTIPEMLAERVGVYGFESPQEAALTYLDRLDRAGVILGQGDCQRGESADHAWGPGDRGPGDRAEPPSGDGPMVEYGGEWWSANRSGCFLDENGTPNVRVTCGDGVYIGVLGRGGDLSVLYEWTIQYPPRLLPDGDAPPPGICINSDRSSP